ncbi:hypothetical protein AgCh_003759 [Apium graveolens]
MATRKYDSFKDLRKGKYDWKVEARVLNIWRGQTKQKEPFKWFNLLLVDIKRSRIHVFVPGTVAHVVEHAVEVGKVYLFKNFTIKDYKEEDKFRCILKDIQIVFSGDTKIIELKEKDVCIEQAVFDFYDLGDLKELSNQTTYLTETDVIGVICDTHLTLAKFKNKFQQQQTQIKFQISDGKNSSKVTFWDAFVEEFDEALKGDLEYPLIIIIGCGRELNGKVKMHLHMLSQDEAYVDCIERGPHVPMRAATGNEPSVPKPRHEWSNPDIEQVRKDKKAMNILFNGVDADMFDNIINCKTAKEV